MGNTDAKSRSEAVARELAKFQGTWKQIVHERDGIASSPDAPGAEPRTTFTGNRFVVTLPDGSIALQGSFQLDPTQQPKAVNWTDTFGPDAGKTFPAIYLLETFCAADEGQPRPTELRSGPGHDLRIHQREMP